jgi:XRE family transcriptional regulator, regulator of sulfur utilization
VRTRKHRKLLGEAIRAIRKKNGMTQEQLAEAADFSSNFVGEIERGEKAASIDSLVRFAAALKVRLSHLVRKLG